MPPPPPLPPRLHPATIRLVLPLLVWRVVFLCGTFASIRLLPPMFNEGGYAENYAHNHGQVAPPRDITTFYSSWDTDHYLRIAREGYEAGAPTLAFQPLWPALIKLGGLLCGGHPLLAGYLLSNALSWAAFLLLHDSVARRESAETADIFLALLICYPGSLFFALPYSESLFLFLCALFLRAVERERWGAVALISALLPMTRTVGLFVLLPLAWALYRGGGSPRIRWLVLGGPLLGAAVSGAILWAEVGSPFAGFMTQRSFLAHSSVTDLVDAGALLSNFFTTVRLHGFTDSALDRVAFVLFLLALVGLVRRGRTDLVSWALPFGLVPAMTVKFMAYTRYLSVVFPVFWQMAVFFTPSSRQPWLWLILPTLFFMQVVLTLRHINWYWAG